MTLQQEWWQQYLAPIKANSEHLQANLGAGNGARLVDWGVEVLEQELAFCATLDPIVGEARLSQKTACVALIISQINVIEGEHHVPEPPTERELRFLLNDLLQHIYDLTAKRTNPYQVKRAKHIAKNFVTMPCNLLFAEMMAMVENTRDIRLNGQA